MPLYAYHCAECDREQDAFNRMDDRDTGAPVCCGKQTRRKVTACMVFVPANIGYECPVTGQVVTSERQRQNIMREHRLIDANDFTPQQVFAQRKKQRAANDALAAQLHADLPEIVKQQAGDLLA